MRGVNPYFNTCGSVMLIGGNVHHFGFTDKYTAYVKEALIYIELYYFLLKQF